jgi:uncharacterized protein (DUF433 family)
MGRVLRARFGGRVTNKAVKLRVDPRDTPIYSVQEAAAYVGVPRSTLRHWLKRPRKGRAVIETASDGAARPLSFYNLLEAHILRVALERDAWLPRVRAAVERLRERMPDSPHPLLEEDLFTASGYRSLFAKTLTGEIENLSFGGQLEFKQLLTRYLSRIDRDPTGPYQLRPYRFDRITLNHRVSGGRPTVRGTGILVEILASRRRAGETPEELARDYRISKSDVRDAIRYSAA